MAEINLSQDTASILQSNVTKNQNKASEQTVQKPDIAPQSQVQAEESSTSDVPREQSQSVAEQLFEQQQKQSEELRESLEKLNEFVPIRSTNLIFEFDELGDPPVVKVVDRESEEVIREIPPKEFRDIAKALEEFADKLDNRGVFFDQSA
ncbi:flagellar protein FlaG [Pseudoalteromonas ruthenica]|uniref:flagellar protein FlaG n=1 Tax=Pseudoalteromonas ruthenica TaxID=151081 RepID=UPI00241E7C6E|nr:flagellar protein FlaG [Pseudoalteromonas ruthenica]|tara:strand:- start:41647 stop:42096 length:450 start_codon:yes stop_codon:yes gene_type:complete